MAKYKYKVQTTRQAFGWTKKKTGSVWGAIGPVKKTGIVYRY